MLAVERKWQELDAARRDLVFTFGKLYTDPKMHSLSKVPGEARFSLDLRSAEPEVLATMRELVPAAAAEIAQRRNVRFELGQFSVIEPTVLDGSLRQELKAGCAALELNAIDLASGGGHDAQDFMQAGVPAAMIFVRNANGSHVAEESMRMDDFEIGTRLLAWQLARDA